MATERTSRSDCIDEYNPEVIIHHLGLNIEGLKGKRLLDIGCGPKGQFVKYLRNKGIEAWGIDRLLEDTEKREFLLQAEAIEIPDLGGKFDIAIAHFSSFRLGNSFFIDYGIQNDTLNSKVNEKNLIVVPPSIVRARSIKTIVIELLIDLTIVSVNARLA